jgi:hypothetical protein
VENWGICLTNLLAVEEICPRILPSVESTYEISNTFVMSISDCESQGREAVAIGSTNRDLQFAIVALANFFYPMENGVLEEELAITSARP